MPETLIAVEGGLDLRSASINAPKGSLSNCFNFEKDQGPGLTRRLGWVRYDGRVTGPEVEDGVIAQYSSGDLTGVFQYGEQVQVISAGRTTLNAICIGFAPPYGGTPAALLLAYPMQTFPSWSDITDYPAATTQIVGMVSGASLAKLLANPMLMNDSSISILAYDNLKRSTQSMHARSVLAVPGRNQSPVDAIFTYNDKSYAIHDCVTISYNSGGFGLGINTIVPVEGHCLRDAGNRFMGRILTITSASGAWESGTAAGQIVLYDYPLGQTMPAGGTGLNLYDATNTTLIASGALTFLNDAPSANNTRALLYSTYEQYVKTVPYQSKYGANVLTPVNYAPPTWSRVRMTREIPFTTVGLPAGSTSFGPTGTNFYSIYEYTRQGLTTNLNILSPLNTGVKAPTVATDSSAGRWLNPNNILVQDANVANYTPVSGNTGFITASITGSGFDFSSIPDGSTILGVVFKMRSSCGNTAGAYFDCDVRLTSTTFQNGLGTQNKAQLNLLTTTLTDYTYGAGNDCWGAQLTTAIVKDPSFGVAVRFKKSNAAASQTVNVDSFQMTVYYAPQTRTVYIRDQTISGAPAKDIVANIIHYAIENGDFPTQTATGVLTAIIGNSEAEGTAAGKIRRLGVGNEIRTAPSNAATNAPGGTLLGYVAAEDYPVTFPPGAAIDGASSRYEVIDANFWDVPEGRAAYIANGAEYATMFDGTFTVRIRTGRPQTSDNPRHVAAHLGYLHLGFSSGAVVNTGTGRPLSTVGAIGAGVYNFGEPVTGMLTMNGQTLGVWTDRATRGLQGNSPTTAGGGSGYTPIMISPAINCIEYSLVNLVGEAVWTSYRGVETVRSVNAYGDFETLPLSAAAQLWLQGRLQVDLKIGSTPSRVVYAIGVRNKRQYRLFFEDGYVFTLTLFDAGDMPVCTIQRLARPNATTVPSGVNDEPMNAGVIRHVHNGTRSDGKEMILAAFENQNKDIIPTSGATIIGPYFPYGVRLDCGYSDDLQPYMPAWIEFNAIYPGFPTQEHKWQGGTMFTNCYGGSQATIYTKLNFDGPIFDTQAPFRLSQSVASDIRTQTITLPTIETRAFIPVPQRYMVFDVSGTGRMLKMRIDATQVAGTIAPVLVPMRITHINLTTSPQAVDRP